MNRATPATGWVKNPDGTQGYTWNPITGCLNHVNGMCKGGGFPCYAYRLAHGRLKDRYLANENVAGNELMTYPRHIECMADPFYPRFWPERMYFQFSYSRSRKAQGIFVCDMSDLFGIGIPEKWTRDVLQLIQCYPQHRFCLLTKQPQNLIKFSPFPENCWVGVTVTNEGITYPDMMEQACRSLAEIKATVKYISFEPLLSSIYKLDLLKIWGINWLIIGAQTRPTVYPKKVWVEEIVEAADKAGIPVFLKDNLMPLLNDLSIVGSTFGRLTSLKSIEPKKGPRQREWYGLRQEMPG